MIPENLDVLPLDIFEGDNLDLWDVFSDKKLLELSDSESTVVYDWDDQVVINN